MIGDNDENQKACVTQSKYSYLLAERILLGLDTSIVVIESLLELGDGDTDLLSKCFTVLETLHETTTDVVLAVPLNLLRCLTVQDKTNGVLQLQREHQFENIGRRENH